jgi:hypothetical protein
MYLAYNTVAIEDLGKPAVMMMNRFIVNDAKSAAAVKNLPELRLMPTTIPTDPGTDNIKDIRPGVTAVIDDLVNVMTRPLTEEEKSPKPKKAEKPSRILFKGNLQEVNRFFYKRGWSDGFPIVPPSEEAVREMLAGTDLPPDHVVVKLPPHFGKATVEKIAVNAVMAGALPTYMPVLIAGVQAIMASGIKVEGYICSMASWAPLWIINGPIRHDLHLNSGWGLLSHEDIANAGIARAMGLIIKNIGGARPGIEDMAVFGNEGKYCMAIGENEEGSPWEPLNVNQGFKKEDNTITVHFPNSHLLMWGGMDAKSLMSVILKNIRQTSGKGGTCLLMTPGAAKRLADEGWTKQQAISYIFEYSRMPAYIHKWSEGGSVAMNTPRERAPLDPMLSMRLFASAENIKIVVGGGAVDQPATISFSGGGDYGGWTTKKIELPPNWNELVKKYKDVVPTYAHY